MLLIVYNIIYSAYQPTPIFGSSISFLKTAAIHHSFF